MLSTASLTAILAASTLALAAPATLNTRFSSSEVVYLSSFNCNGDTCYEADYYSNIAHSHNQQHPDSTSNADPMNNTPLFATEWHFKFPSTGVTFTSDLNYGAAPPAVPVGGYAGKGSNPKPFSCYVDDGSTLYTKSDGRQVAKEYYCRPN